jgi:DNA replicative helicase MCM subunit Mcm2 (Cdc46/Mcm family)
MNQFEIAAKDALKLFLTSQGNTDISSSSIPDFQIVLRSSQIPLSLRNLTADHVNKLIKVIQCIVHMVNLSLV